MAARDAPVITHDFETRSLANIKQVGSWKYSKHPQTQPLCLAYNLPWEGDLVRLWHRSHPAATPWATYRPTKAIEESPRPEDLFYAIKQGCIVEAHNAFFEWVIWHNVMVPQWGWPEIPEEQYRCSAAMASAVSLPRSLEEACEARGLPERFWKDTEGGKVMRKMAKPRKPLKAEVQAWESDPLHGDEPMPLLWHETEEEIERLWSYNKQDVRSEKAFSASVPDLSEYEQRVWFMDQRLNRRGVAVDLDMCRAALKMAEDWKDKLNAELKTITGVARATQRQQVKAWLAEYESLELPDTAADTLEWYLDKVEMSGRARRVLQIVRSVNRTSTRKYEATLRRADDDGRVRDIMMYHGAERTGRWAGKGIQVHNYPARDLCVKDFDQAAEDIKSGHMEWCHAYYGDVMEFLSHSLRGSIVAGPGRRLAVADYSAIEARCVLWQADAKGALDVFRKGGDIYCDLASRIYRREILKGRDNHERQFGKQAVLGLGYGMGYITFLLTCRRYGIKFSLAQAELIMGAAELCQYEEWVERKLLMDRASYAQASRLEKAAASRDLRRIVDAREDPASIVHELALMKYTVDVYRSTYPQVKSMWKQQEAAAIEAVRYPDFEVEAGKFVWYMDHTLDSRALRCRLPSGRPLTYWDPEVKGKKTSWGEVRPHLSYMGIDSLTKRWKREGTYGGKIVENQTQANARDIMAHAMVLSEETGIYFPIMSVHDEGVSEVAENRGSIDEYEGILSDTLPCFEGCPITAEAELLTRYKK